MLIDLQKIQTTTFQHYPYPTWCIIIPYIKARNQNFSEGVQKLRSESKFYKNNVCFYNIKHVGIK